MRKDVTDCPLVSAEDRGVNTKEWLLVDGQEALFKETQIKENGESTYADYGEVIVTDICNLLGVPCAKTELAVKDGKNGCISYSFCKPGEELIDIGTVIQNVRIKFSSKNMIDNETKDAYCVEMILEGLESIATSKKELAELRKALFVSVVTDSLIDHYDRNPSNLAVLSSILGIALSPKYDNGTSLSISVPQEVLEELVLRDEPNDKKHAEFRKNLYSKIGYLGKKFVKYDELEMYIFNYHYDEVKDFMPVIEERFTDENIDAIFENEKYADLSSVHKEMIKGKLKANRDSMLERFRTISKKAEIDSFLYTRSASQKFAAHSEKGTITAAIPEYAELLANRRDLDYDYVEDLDVQITKKIQSITDIAQLSRFFGIPVDALSKREKNLLKWVVIIENIQKATNKPEVLDTITHRLGFIKDDSELMHYMIKDKFKDEHDILEAREIIFGETGVGEKNLNLYIAKKFVDASVMRNELRDQRMQELRTFITTMREAIELEHIAREHVPVKSRYLQKLGFTDRREITSMHFELARAYRNNPRITEQEMKNLVKTLSKAKLSDGTKEEVTDGVFVEKADADDIRAHTYQLPDGKKIAIFNKTTKLGTIAAKMGIEYFAQIVDHPSGNGVTVSFTSKRGVKFPPRFSKYAQAFVSHYQDKFNPKSIKLLESDNKNAVNCFIVTSIGDPSARIPNMNAEKMTKLSLELFSERQKDRTQADD